MLYIYFLNCTFALNIFLPKIETMKYKLILNMFMILSALFLLNNEVIAQRGEKDYMLLKNAEKDLSMATKNREKLQKIYDKANVTYEKASATYEKQMGKNGEKNAKMKLKEAEKKVKSAEKDIAKGEKEVEKAQQKVDKINEKMGNSTDDAESDEEEED